MTSHFRGLWPLIFPNRTSKMNPVLRKYSHRNRKEALAMAVQTLTLDQAARQLLDCYAGYFDIFPAETEESPLVARMVFHASTAKYVLSKKAVLWQAGSHEYVYLFQVPHLTLETYRACEELAYRQGMAQIQPGPEHMYSYITALFLCDTCDDEARKALKKCRRYQSFKLSYWGWMDFHTALAELSLHRVTGNFSGHSAAQTLETTLFHKTSMFAKFKRRERSYL